jgi:hypothetical protein
VRWVWGSNLAGCNIYLSLPISAELPFFRPNSLKAGEGTPRGLNGIPLFSFFFKGTGKKGFFAGGF